MLPLKAERPMSEQLAGAEGPLGIVSSPMLELTLTAVRK